VNDQSGGGDHLVPGRLAAVPSNSPSHAYSQNSHLLRPPLPSLDGDPADQPLLLSMVQSLFLKDRLTFDQVAALPPQMGYKRETF